LASDTACNHSPSATSQLYQESRNTTEQPIGPGWLLLIHQIPPKPAYLRVFGRQDARGFERLVAGIAIAHKDDDVRLARASAVLDDLYECFKRKGTGVA
jgi:hypothetical protein